METRRRTVLGILGALLPLRGAKGQAAPRSSAKELSRQTLTGPQAGMEAILVEVTAAPGAPSMAHRHPGFVMGYVLDGEMDFAVNGQGAKVVKAGETFFEPIGVVHTKGGSAKPDAPVKFLAFIVAPKGSPVTLPV